MTPLPNAEKERADLERLVTAETDGGRRLPPERDRIVRVAERLALRLANPVRVALIGLPGAGKSTLAGFLVGHRFEPPRTADGGRLPVILRHGERPSGVAGWWSGIEIPLSGVDLSAASEYGPDYAELRLSEHYADFKRLTKMADRLIGGNELSAGDWEFFEDCTERDALFPEIELEWFARVEYPI